jgi:hypothetical protein
MSLPLDHAGDVYAHIAVGNVGAAGKGRGSLSRNARQLAGTNPMRESYIGSGHSGTESEDCSPAGLSGENLLPQDVGMPAVLSELAQDMQVHPSQRQRPAAVAADGVVKSERCGGAA